MGLDEKDIDDKIIEEYMKQLDIDTPDLWDRIEAGISEPEMIWNENDMNQTPAYNQTPVIDSKPGKKKSNIITFPRVCAALALCAAIAITILVVPMFTDDTRTRKNKDYDGITDKIDGIPSSKGDSAADEVEGYYEDTEVAYEDAPESEETADNNAVNTIKPETDKVESGDYSNEEVAEEAEESGDSDFEEDTTEAAGSADAEEQNSSAETTESTNPEEDDTEDAPVVDTEENTSIIGGESGSVSGKYVMVNGYVYVATGASENAITDSFAVAGSVSSNDTSKIPESNNEGCNVPTGSSIYTSANNYVIYVETSAGVYEEFVID